ncbi:MAG: hypothetical protein HDS04_03200 [Bacteroides sp.]|nr:hypothetical protein [Bacteroides sp.]
MTVIGLPRTVKVNRRIVWIEAINLDEPLVWFDDYVFSVEKKILEQAGKIDPLIPIDLCRENELNRIISILKDKLLMW